MAVEDVQASEGNGTFKEADLMVVMAVMVEMLF